MMCYKDQTWCKETTCTHKSRCDRFFTDTDAANAEAWWGSEGAPVCFFGERPKCYPGESVDFLEDQFRYEKD